MRGKAEPGRGPPPEPKQHLGPGGTPARRIAMALASVQCPYCKNKVDILHFAPTISCPWCKKTCRLQRRSSAQRRTPAQLQPAASPEWAALRLWATSIRDNIQFCRNTRDDSKTLVCLLDAFL